MVSLSLPLRRVVSLFFSFKLLFGGNGVSVSLYVVVLFFFFKLLLAGNSVSASPFVLCFGLVFLL